MENHQKTEKNLNDLNQHLIELELGINTFQTDHSTNKIIYLFCNNILDKTRVIRNILFYNNLYLAVELLTIANKLFADDKELSFVNIVIENTKRPYDKSKTAQLYLKK